VVRAAVVNPGRRAHAEAAGRHARTGRGGEPAAGCERTPSRLFAKSSRRTLLHAQNQLRLQRAESCDTLSGRIGAEVLTRSRIPGCTLSSRSRKLRSHWPVLLSWYWQACMARVRKRIDIYAKRIPQKNLNFAIETSSVRTCPVHQHLVQFRRKPQRETLGGRHATIMVS
jgi:hypothetical protein